MIPIVHSQLLQQAGVRHGFSERGAQTEDDPFGEFNVKSDAATPDHPHKAAENRQKILTAVGADPERAVFLRTLAHSNDVFKAQEEDAGTQVDDYDAIMTNQELTVGLSVADCVPILLFDPKNTVIAAAHAGWRGTVAGVASESIRAMQQTYDSTASEVMAVIGPSICGNCYEVNTDVSDLFEDEFVSRSEGKLTVDLRVANKAQLRSAGVNTIDDLDLCTLELSDRFFSVRAQKQTGRFLAFISLPPTAQ